MATSWSDWYAEVRPQAPQAPTVACDLALRNAAIQLCREGLLLQQDLTPINTVAGTSSYALTPSGATIIEQILEVQYDDEVIDPIQQSNLEREFGEEWETTQGDPTAYFSLDGTSVTLVKVPAVSLTGGLKVKVAVVPSSSAADLNDAIARSYHKAIAKGALAELLLSPNKPYTNFDLGRKMELDFQEACAIAHIRAHRGRTKARSRSRTIYGR